MNLLTAMQNRRAVITSPAFGAGFQPAVYYAIPMSDDHGLIFPLGFKLDYGNSVSVTQDYLLSNCQLLFSELNPGINTVVVKAEDVTGDGGKIVHLELTVILL